VRVRFAARLRLTLLFGCLFLGAGAVLLCLNYALVRYSLEAAPSRVPLPVPGVPPGTPPPPPADGGAPADITYFTTTVLPRSVEAARQQAIAESLTALVRQSLVALAAMTALAIVLGWVVAARVLRPVQEITAVARRLSARNLRERIALDGPPDEMKELADTFDVMLDRLEAAFEAQRRFAANASHELRTPLAIMRTEVDVALGTPDPDPAAVREMGASLRALLDRCERLIEALLVLARSDAGVETRERVDLAEAAALALAQARAEAETANLAVRRDLAPAPAVGDRALLERLVANLVENAVRHNVRGGFVRVATGADAAGVWLVVENSGPPIPTHEAEGLFAPFRRLASERTQSRRGAGLGLSIVRSVAAAHGGEATLAPRPEGGMVATVRLPAPQLGGGDRRAGRLRHDHAPSA
jgi:signal transduction histidine kinase